MIRSILKRKFTPTLKDTIAGIGYNAFGIIFSLLQITILLKYLGKESYGVWITLYSVCNWIAFLDGGLGNGMRNMLTKALVEEDVNKSRKIISTGYISILFFLISVYIIVILLHVFIDWNLILKDNSINFNIVALFIFGFFLLNMVLKLISKIYFSFGKASLSFLTPTVTSFITLLSIYSLYYFEVGNKMWNVAIIYSFVPLLVLSIFTIHFYLIIAPKFRPKISFFDRALVKPIILQGSAFFLIQMSSGILQAIAPVFITLWFTVQMTADYQISMRYYSILIVLLNIILQTLWNPITKTYLSNNKKKLYYYIRVKFLISIGFVVILILMWLVSDFVYRTWLGKEFIINSYLNLVCAIFVGSLILSKSFTNFLNATGDIKLQSAISLIIVIFYLPFVYLGVKILNLGIGGLILVPVIFFVIQTIVAAIQLSKMLKK